MIDVLVKIASSQREDYLSLNETSHLEVQRDGELILKEVLNSPMIKVVIGPRRAGKSTLIRHTLKSVPHAYFSFEDERLPPKFDSDQLVEALQTVWNGPRVYFFDEIQNLRNWEKFLHRLHAARKNLFVTGSNSRLLSKELSSTLTGRHHTFTLLPFSWKEVLKAKHRSKEKGEFLEYLRNGGFPDVVVKNSPPENYLVQLYDSILVRDIVQRYRIRNIFALRAVCDLLIRSVGSHVSGRSLQKALPVNLNNTTIENYLRYLDEAFLATLLQKFEPSLSKQKKADRKPYLYDTGFIRAINPSQISDNYGQILETYVFLSLIRMGAKPNTDLFYYQAPSGQEVDFIWFKKGGKPLLIQSCWTLIDQSTRQREINALIGASEKFASENLWVVTYQEAKTYIQDKHEIRLVPADKFEGVVQ